MTKPTMEWRHFEAIAAIIRDMKGEVTLAYDIEEGDFGGPNDREVREVARYFAHRLPETNPNFNRARFLEACGVES